MSPIRCSIAFAVAAGASPLISAATLHVPKDHASIQAAIDAAGPGDRVEIAAGTYREALVIPPTKPGLRLVGKGQVVLDQYAASDDAKFGIVSSANGVRIERLTVIHTGTGNNVATTRGVLAHGTETVLSRVAVISGGACGIEVTGAGSRVDRCSASDSSGGIQCSAADAVLARCAVSGAVSFGIAVNADRARVTGCRVRGVQQAGIDVNSADAVVEDCVVASCGLGIRMAGNGSSARFNRVEDCATYGIRAEDAVEIRGNAIRRTGSFGSTGVQLALGAYTGEATDNDLRDGLGDGIFVADSPGCRIQGNRVTGHSRDGIAIFATVANCEIRDNVVTRNRGEGIENAGAATLLIGNSLKGNRLDLANKGSFAEFADNQFESGGEAAQPEVD